MPFIRTVAGDIDPASLGVTLYHEHLLTRPPAHVPEPDYLMDREDAAAQELGAFRAVGGRALVEMTAQDYGRDPAGLRRLAEATGVHIVCVTGRIKEAFSGRLMTDWSMDQLADEMVRDIQEGIGDTGVRAGLIKAGSSRDMITAAEERVFRAAARAHRATGASIATHTEAGTMGLEQVVLLQHEGVPAERIVIGHIDRRLDWDYHLALLQTGVTIGYDQVGKEKYAADSVRADYAARVVRAGYGRQLLVSGDMARRSNWSSYGGGPGLGYLLRTFVPLLRAAGLADEDINQILIGNPSRLLAIGTHETR